MNRYNLEDIICLAEEKNCTISSLVKEKEALSMGITLEEVTKTMEAMYDVMRQVYDEGVLDEKRSVSGLTGGEGHRLQQYSSGRQSEGVYVKAAARAMGIANVNASMGRIVAAPTAGSCGIIPGALITLAEEHGKDREEIVDALFTAAYIGKVIADKASLSGAEGGCQAECGSAAAMAAGAGVEMCGGTPRQVAHAVAFALKAVMGLVCDPVAGLVESPCIKRNGFGAAQALLAIDMALAGIESVIPADEVIDAMGIIGRTMPESLKETAEGGIAATPTGRKISDYLASSGSYCPKKE
jgi:L-serine dehydratase